MCTYFLCTIHVTCLRCLNCPRSSKRCSHTFHKDSCSTVVVVLMSVFNIYAITPILSFLKLRFNQLSFPLYSHQPLAWIPSDHALSIEFSVFPSSIFSNSRGLSSFLELLRVIKISSFFFYIQLRISLQTHSLQTHRMQSLWCNIPFLFHHVGWFVAVLLFFFSRQLDMFLCSNLNSWFMSLIFSLLYVSLMHIINENSIPRDHVGSGLMGGQCQMSCFITSKPQTE